MVTVTKSFKENTPRPLSDGGYDESFTTVTVPAGEPLVRVFHLVDNPHPMITKLNFQIYSPINRGGPNSAGRR